MQDKKWSKINFKFMITIGIILAIGGGAVMFYTLTSERAEFKKQVEERTQMVNKVIIESAYRIMATGDTSIRDYLENLVVIQAVSRLRLIKSAGIAEQYGINEDEKPKGNDDLRALKGESVKNILIEDGIRFYRQIIPVKFNQACMECHEGQPGEVAAALSVTVSLKESDIALKNRLIILSLLFIVGIISVLVILYYYVQWFVVNPIKRISEVSQLIASEGDLTEEIRINSNDEIGQLAYYFNSMVSHLKKLVASIQDAGLRLGSVSAEFLASSEQQASGAAEQAASVSEITATVEELSTSASQIADNADSVVKVTEQTVRRAEIGQKSVTDTAGGMENIRNKAQETGEKIIALGEHSQQIGEVIDIIDDIANQTKLLSLNAAIEAAKAGEYGKGFAVVAVEIRQLAESVVKSTAKIKDIVSEIQAASNASVMSTEQNMKGIEDGVSLAKKAGESLREILNIAQQTAQSARQIGSATLEQKSASEQVALSMKEISNVVRQSAAGAKEGTASAGELNKLAEELKKGIDKFKIN